MCTPAVSLAFTVGSSILGAIGAAREGQAQAAQFNHQAAIARNNAQIARNNQITSQRFAAFERQRGDIEAQQEALKAKRLRGQQIASLAANGQLVSGESALRLTDETLEFGQLDALTIRSGAEREALGFEAQGANFASQVSNFNAQADGLVAAGQNSVASANGRALGSLLSGAGSVASKWFTFNRAGADVF